MRWHHHPNMEIWKVGNQNLVEGGISLTYHMLRNKVIRENYDDLLDRHDNVNLIHKCPPRMCIIFGQSFYYSVITPVFRKESHTRWCVVLVPCVKIGHLMDIFSVLLFLNAMVEIDDIKWLKQLMGMLSKPFLQKGYKSNGNFEMNSHYI